jgi:hypothetical protein
MTRSFRILLAAFATAFAIAGASTASAGSITLSDPNCDSFTVGGPAGNQTLTCVVSNPPSCTIQGPSAGSVGTPITLTAQCSPAATSWTWTGCSSSTSQCQSTATSAGILQYQVQGSNANGPGPTSIIFQVPWNVGAPPAPTGCVASIATNPSTLTNAGGTATVSVSGCSPANVTYDWSRNGLPGWSTSATPAADPLASGGTIGSTTSFQVNVCNGSTCINVPAGNPLTAFVPGTGGGGSGVDLSACVAAGYTGKVVDIPYPASTANARVFTKTNLGTFGNNDMIIVRFVAQGPETNVGAMIQMGFDGLDVGRLVTLSTQPCAVATAFPPTSTILQSQVSDKPIIRASVDAVKAGYAKLTQGVTYYVNYVNRSDYNGSPTCTSSTCGAYIDFN